MPTYFYTLDMLRGCAALTVVLWHWQHFFLPMNPQGDVFRADQQPLAGLFSLAYTQGALAVQLFFCLSGFIFYWLYAQRISDGRMTASRFAVLRFSRLYPLHLVTLLFVALMQPIYHHFTDSPFVYARNDGTHFLLQLGMASSWIVELGHGFNGPVWSVSIEVLLYALFFLLCRTAPVSFLVVGLAVVVGYAVKQVHNLLGVGIEFFFLGGGMYLLYHRLMMADPWRVARWIPWLAGVAWAATILVHRLPYNIPSQQRWSQILLPLTVLALALWQAQRPTAGQRLAWLGDLSYGIYLLHFPLQLLIATIAASFMIHPPYESPWFLGSFLIVLLLLAYASYHGLEVPMQRYLRTRLTTVALLRTVHY